MSTPMMVNSFNRFVWGGLCGVAGLLILLYLSWGLQAGDGRLILPLDDTYIHFQYARQLATGHPYLYNDSDEPTSGATSFLYSPLLAVGYGIGFRGLALGYWAVGLGALCYILSAGLIYAMIATETRLSRLIAGMVAMAFLLSGPFIWAALSGMETLLFTATILATLYAYHCQRWNMALLMASWAALARPEGAVIALSVWVAVLWETRRWSWWYVFPVVAVLLQPIINLFVAGSASATGNQAKSILYNTTIPTSERLTTVVDYYGRIWREWLTGANPVDGHYLPTVLFLLALVYALMESWQSFSHRRVLPAFLALAWLIIISGGIATLETAFWHFKRYQLPLMALFFPLGGWMLTWLSAGRWRVVAVGLGGVIVVASSWTTLAFARRYHDNVYVVTHQQIAMAEWVDANLPPDARIGVHDVGVMRYIGNRATYDMVGLTTEGVAPAWRQGSGTLYDTMANHPHRPDYFAVYHDIQALPLLAQVDVFGDELARFSVSLPPNTVASATSTQIVSRPMWPPEGEMWLNVGDLASEDEHGYQWWQDETASGFASVVRNLPLRGCRGDRCQVIDGARILTGGESFDLPVIDRSEQYLITLRVHAANYARLLVGCGDEQRVLIVPAMPGFALDIVITQAADQRRFCVTVDGRYEPLGYAVEAQPLPVVPNPPTQPTAIFHGPDGHGELLLSDIGYHVADKRLQIGATWFSMGTLEHDGKLFVHVYRDPTASPTLQTEQWLMGDRVPPANLTVGPFNESYELNLGALSAGTYQVAVGIYDPNDGKRYTVTTANTTDDRLFLGTIEIVE